jgi:DAK2 domain fusion protein YloV
MKKVEWELFLPSSFYILHFHSDRETMLGDRAPAPIANQTTLTWDGAQLLAALTAAARWLEQHTDAVNALNVFPVPDGDTGTNMSLTLSGAIQDVAPDPSCAVVSERVKYWATMRGRGNSGIILSQVLRGMAQALAGHTHMGAVELAAALSQASATAYQAVMKPVEGTMLTVIREAAEAAMAAAGHGASLVVALEAAVEGARDAVRRTPDMLKTLRDAGVVDAGGEGLALILEGMLRYARREQLELEPAQAPVTIAFADIHGIDDFGYCTNFVLHGADLPFDEIRTTLANMGQSAVIVGDAELIKVHIHLLMPGDALNYAVRFGALSAIEITNMDLQREALHRKSDDRRPTTDDTASTQYAIRNTQHISDVPVADIGIVAVAPGDGFAAIFRSLNVDEVVGGGQTMNPSTEDLLGAIERLPQHKVIVLPNNGNIIMAARQAAEMSAKQVHVLASKTLPQGIAAKLSFNYQAGLEENLRAMAAALRQVRTAEITTAVRDAAVDGVQVRAGQTIGLLDGDLVTAADSRTQVIDELLARIDLDEREIVTIYFGQAVERSDAEALAARISERFTDVEVEVQAGGQPLYDYIISAE